MKKKIITIVNKIEQLNELSGALEALSSEWSIPSDTILSLNLVVEELVTNIILYGYKDKAEHQIIIRFLLNAEIIQVQIEDDAIEFNPLLMKEPDINESIENRKVGGLGIHFVRKLTDKITYERTGNKNILTFEKKIEYQ